MSCDRELKPLVRRVERHLMLTHRKLDRMLSMVEVLVVQLVQPVALPEEWTDKPIAREEIYRAEALLRVIESRMRRLVQRTTGTEPKR